MTDAEKARALRWLDNEESLYSKMLPGSLGYYHAQQIRTLKALLAEPRLPAEAAPAAAEAMRDAWVKHRGDVWPSVYRALYAHLSAPIGQLEEIQRYGT